MDVIQLILNFIFLGFIYHEVQVREWVLIVCVFTEIWRYELNIVKYIYMYVMKNIHIQRKES